MDAPQSLNETLRNSKKDGLKHNINQPWTSGVLDLSGENCPIYIPSAQLSNFGSSLGPRGYHIYINRIGATAPFGSTIRDVLQNELQYFVATQETIKRF